MARKQPIRSRAGGQPQDTIPEKLPGQVQKLNVIAHGTHEQAHPGNQQWVAIAVCVTSDNATPVSGLVKGNFKVRGLLSNGTHIGSSIKLFIDFEDNDPVLAGYYCVFVGTTDNNIWVPGECVFAVIVRRGKSQGRTLAVVDLG